MALGAGQVASIERAYESFKTDIYESLLLQTRLKPYLEKLSIGVVDGQVRLDFTAVESGFRNAIEAHQQAGIIDLVEFISAVGISRLQSLHWDATSFLLSQLNIVDELVPFSQELRALSVRLLASSERSAGGTAGADLVVGGSGSEVLSGSTGDDILVGRGGNDTLSGQAGNDTLSGGAGGDRLDGGVGNDTYLVSSGDGNDTLLDSDTVAGNADVLVFTDVQSGSISAIERRGNDLYLKYGNSDTLTLLHHFDLNRPQNRIELFRFSDNVTWTEADVRNMATTNGDAQANWLQGYNDGTNRIFGWDGNDRLFGGAMADMLDGGSGMDSIMGLAGDDRLLGQAGNDTIFGGDGNDLLSGGLDNDQLFGDAGNDTLDGGVGQDILNGGAGNDTYVLYRGNGRDSIIDIDSTRGSVDTVSILEGVSASQLWFKRAGANLEVSVIGTQDLLSIANWFYGGSNQIEVFKTADGSVLQNTEVEKLVTAMQALAPPVPGQIIMPDVYTASLSSVIAEAWKPASTQGLSVLG